MKKEGIVIAVFSILLIAAIAVLVFGYFKGKELTARINQLEKDNTQLIDEKEKALSEIEHYKTEVQILRTDIQNLNSKLSLLQEDIARMYKSCNTQNACKGKYPSIRWYCNSAGDEVNNPTHVCVCDPSCNLIKAEIQK